MNDRKFTFYNRKTDEKLLSITVEGTFRGEIDSTVHLLAYENKLNPSDIRVRIEEQLNKL